MKRFLIMSLLGCVALPAWAQADPGLAEEVPPDRDQRRERIEEMRELLQALQDREKLEADRDEIEVRLQQLLLERRLEVLPPAEALPQEQPGEGVVVVMGRPMKIRPYTNPLADKPRAEIVKLLGHADYAKREQAEAHLLSDDTLDRVAMRGLIQGAASEEARHRLIRVAEHHVMREVREREFGAARKLGPGLEDNRFRARETAAVGFSYQPMLIEDNPQTQTPAVIVTATMPGFPGHAHLRPGDLVVAIDGQTAKGIRHRELITNWLSNRIAFHEPGDTLALTVVRDGTAIEIKIVCAQGTALSRMYSTNGFNAAFREGPYNKQWDQARAALTQGLPEPKVLVPAE